MSRFSSPPIIQNKSSWPSGKAPVPNDPPTASALLGIHHRAIFSATLFWDVSHSRASTVGGLGNTVDPEFESQRVHFLLFILFRRCLRFDE
jgi:hypothetical protein